MWHLPIPKKGKEILDNFSEYLPKFKKSNPYDYKPYADGYRSDGGERSPSEQAQIEAFYANTRG